MDAQIERDKTLVDLGADAAQAVDHQQPRYIGIGIIGEAIKPDRQPQAKIITSTGLQAVKKDFRIQQQRSNSLWRTWLTSGSVYPSWKRDPVSTCAIPIPTIPTTPATLTTTGGSISLTANAMPSVNVIVATKYAKYALGMKTRQSPKGTLKILKDTALNDVTIPDGLGVAAVLAAKTSPSKIPREPVRSVSRSIIGSKTKKDQWNKNSAVSNTDRADENIIKTPADDPISTSKSAFDLAPMRDMLQNVGQKVGEVKRRPSLFQSAKSIINLKSTAPVSPKSPENPGKSVKSLLDKYEEKAKLGSAFGKQVEKAKTRTKKVAAKSQVAPHQIQGGQPQQQKEQQGDSDASRKADDERNQRHEDVVALMNGRLNDRLRFRTEFPNKYKVGDLLGDGAFGFVISATRVEDNVEVAVKFIVKRKVPKDLWVEDLPMEIHLLKMMRHPNIITYLDHFDEEYYILLVTEMHGTCWTPTNPVLNPTKNPGLRAKPKVTGISDTIECSPLYRLTKEQEKLIRRRTSYDLFECIDTVIPEYICRKIFAQIAFAVEHMHIQHVCHKDLKDENIVVDENYCIKIIDFGSASLIPECEEDYFEKFNGTAHFASPEIVQGNPFRGPEAEIWTLGVLLFTIMCGENPFQHKEDILKGEFVFPSNVTISDGARDLISRMLTYDECERATIDE
ncbi:hypothetical protein HK102_003043, partial [Quaeritorhiza haematococci]